MYEMFLGPVRMSKPWDTKVLKVCTGFLKNYGVFFIMIMEWIVSDEKANARN
jgi:hypothetical protein